MNDLGLHNLVPVVTFLFVMGALVRRMYRAAGPRPARAASRNALVPTLTAAMRPVAPPPAAARPARRRLAEPAIPAVQPRAAQPRPTLVPAMGDMLSNEAAAAFPVLDLSLGDGSPSGTIVAQPRRRRGLAGGAPVGSRAWGANAILAAEILGPPVGLRPGATVGVPHAF